MKVIELEKSHGFFSEWIVLEGKVSEAEKSIPSFKGILKVESHYCLKSWCQKVLDLVHPIQQQEHARCIKSFGTQVIWD